MHCAASAGRITISILPDNILLHIFLIDGLEYQDERPITNFLVMKNEDRVRNQPWTWHRLGHVCQRWRSIVFASPNFLDLRLVCGPRTPIELTCIWPPLPIILTNALERDELQVDEPDDYEFDVDAAIMHPDRIREICLFDLTRSFLQRLASATLMQEQFPALVHLTLEFGGSHGRSARPAPALPDGFLGGSVPRLQSLELHFILFPALPKLLLSATDLVRLDLWGIPHSGYFSPEAIVTGLAILANLKSLFIGFESPLSRPDRKRQRPPPLTRTVLPALTRFDFKGASEYLEDFVARIDAPLLDSIYITFFLQLIFDTPRLAQFMGRTARFQELKEAYVIINRSGVRVETLRVSPPAWTFINPETSGLKIPCNELDWQLSSIAQVFTSFFPFIYQVEHLYLIHERPNFSNSPWISWGFNIEDVQWLEIFHPFTAVKNLYLPEKFVPSIALAMQELVGGRTTEVLPTLQNIFLEGPLLEGIQTFVAARQLSGHPITVFPWERDWLQ